MTVPAVIQVTPIVQTAAYSTARTLVFPAPVTAGSCIVVLGWAANAGAATMAAVTASVAMTDEVFSRRIDKSLRYEANRGITMWTAQNCQGGETDIVITPAIADAANYGGFVALELSAAAAAFEAAVSADAENTTFNVAVGPCPATGSISQGDTMAIVLSMVNLSSNAADAGWITPSGWTERAKTISSASGLMRPGSAPISGADWPPRA
jgi:hypothetical protein